MEESYIDLDQLVHDVFVKGANDKRAKSYFRELVHQILKKAGYTFNISLTSPVEKLRVLLGIRLAERNRLSSDACLSFENDVWTIGIAADQIYRDDSGEYFTERGRFSLAHEIAHYILKYLEDNHSTIAESLELESINSEQICDFIASELLIPSCILSSEILKDLGGTDRREGLNEEPSLLSISQIERLRKALLVSRLTLIRKLNKSPLLDSLESGFIVSMFSTNRKTGRSPALRVYKASVPSWGFIPENVKLSKIGLDAAGYAHEIKKYGAIRQWNGTVIIHEKSASHESKQWIKREMVTWGENALYRYDDKSDYTVTAFKWQRMSGS